MFHPRYLLPRRRCLILTTSKFPGTKKISRKSAHGAARGSDCCDFHVAYRVSGHFVGGRGAAEFKPGPQAPSREGDTGRQAGRRA